MFFNGNTFAAIGRELTFALLADLPPLRRREAGSAVAHYIAGVLDREAMVEIVDSLCAAAELRPGDRVQTLRGTTHGRVVRLLPDGRLVWRPDGSRSEKVGDRVSILCRNGIWQAQYMVGRRQVRKSLRTKSKKEARLRAIRIDNQLLVAGDRAAAPDPT